MTQDATTPDINAMMDKAILEAGIAHEKQLKRDALWNDSMRALRTTSRIICWWVLGMNVLPNLTSSSILPDVGLKAAMHDIFDLVAQGDDAQAHELVEIFSSPNEVAPNVIDMAAYSFLSNVYQTNADLMADYTELLAEQVRTRCLGGDVDRCPGEMRDKVRALYMTYRMSVTDDVWNAERQAIFKNLIAHDPMLIEAREQWFDVSGYSLEDRKAAIQQFLNLHAQAYSDGALQVTPATFELGPIDNTDTHAYYRHATNTIRLRPADVYDFFDDVMWPFDHEGRHRMRRVMVEGLDEPAVKAYMDAHGLSGTARIMKQTSGDLALKYDVGDLVYYFKPGEQDARYDTETALMAGNPTAYLAEEMQKQLDQILYGAPCNSGLQTAWCNVVPLRGPYAVKESAFDKAVPRLQLKFGG